MFMKKFIIILLLFVFNMAHALDYQSYCSTEKPKKTAGGYISSLSGFNFVLRNLSEKYIEKQLKKEFNTKFDVNLDNFYGVSLLSGQFGSMSAKAKNINYDDFYLSSLNFSSLCDYNYIKRKDDKIVFEENSVFGFIAQITQSDIDKAVKTSKFQKMVDKINNDKVLSSLFTLQSLGVSLNDKDIELKFNILPLKNFAFLSDIIKPIKFSLKAEVKVYDNKIQLDNLKINSKKISFIPYNEILNMVKLLTYDIDLDDNNTKLFIDNAKIKDKKLNVNGFVVVLKQ